MAYPFDITKPQPTPSAEVLAILQSIKDKKYGGKVKSVDNSISYVDDLSETQIKDMKAKNIVCADPGKKYLLYMMDNSGNELKYSCMQRDTESLAKRNRRIICLWQT